jgi:hypothetical protein
LINFPFTLGCSSTGFTLTLGYSLMGFASTFSSLFDLTSILGLGSLLGFSSTIIIEKIQKKNNKKYQFQD